MHLNPLGLIVDRGWARAGVIRPEVAIDIFTVMPNHLHGLITIHPPDVDSVGAHRCVPNPGVTNTGIIHPTTPTSNRAHIGIPLRHKRSLSSIIAQFKALTTVAINNHRGTHRAKIWQRGFHEHVVRDDADFDRIIWYIVTNPERWDTDEENRTN